MARYQPVRHLNLTTRPSAPTYTQQRLGKWELLNYIRLKSHPSLAKYTLPNIQPTDRHFQQDTMKRGSPFWYTLFSAPDDAKFAVKIKNATPSGQSIAVTLGQERYAHADKAHGTAHSTPLKQLPFKVKQALKRFKKRALQSLTGSPHTSFLPKHFTLNETLLKQRLTELQQLETELNELKNVMGESTFGPVGTKLIISLQPSDQRVTLVDIERSLLYGDKGITPKDIQRCQQRFIQHLCALSEEVSSLKSRLMR